MRESKNQLTKSGAGPERLDPFWEALCDPARRPFAVELDSPAGADVSGFLSGARALRDGGAALLTVADCPFALPRMDASLMACKIKRELGMDVMPHMTCRDRNLNATRALLLGLSAEGIGNVLIVTGDPIPKERRDAVKGVYDFNSRKLIKFVDSMNRETLSSPFRVFAALNINARSFPIQLALAKEKEKNGAVGFFTQPIFTEEALENLMLARKALKGKILGGILPIVSHRNALYLNSEVAGIRVDEETIALYAGADREKGEELAVELSVSMAQRMAPLVDGYYLITPFSRTALIVRIMERLRRDMSS